jgi:alkylation response protein AidB-like acyl-CoA dehydrogenase
MQFLPDEAQSMLRDIVRRWVEKDYSAAGDDTLGCDPTRWVFLAEQGWLAAGLSEEVGGLGGNAFDLCIIAEELGRGLVRDAFVPFAGATANLLAQIAPGSDLLRELLWGGGRPLLAHGEAVARGEQLFIETTARAQGGGFVLDGRKDAVLGGPFATSLLISARIEGEDGISIFQVDPGQPGLTRQSFRTIDNRAACNVVLDGVELPGDALIGPRSGADDGLMLALDQAILASCAEAVGAMEAAMLMTRDYLRTRKQFGSEIGKFQALQHRLADMFIETEQARSIVLRAIDAACGDNVAQRQRLAAAAKSRVAQAGLFVGGQAIQLHGGIGMTEEYGVGHYFKRLLAFDLYLGSGNAHLERFAALKKSD